MTILCVAGSHDVVSETGKWPRLSGCNAYFFISQEVSLHLMSFFILQEVAMHLMSFPFHNRPHMICVLFNDPCSIIGVSKTARLVNNE